MCTFLHPKLSSTQNEYTKIRNLAENNYRVVTPLNLLRNRVMVANQLWFSDIGKAAWKPLCMPVGSRTPIDGTGIRNSIH